MSPHPEDWPGHWLSDCFQRERGNGSPHVKVTKCHDGTATSWISST